MIIFPLLNERFFDSARFYTYTQIPITYIYIPLLTVCERERESMNVSEFVCMEVSVCVCIHGSVCTLPCLSYFDYDSIFSSYHLSANILKGHIFFIKVLEHLICYNS